MRLLMACWREAAVKSVPVAFVLMVTDFVNDGFTWESVGGALVFRPLCWGAMTLGWAAFGVRSLRRRARTAGIALTGAALDERQRHVLRPVRVSDGWQERVREQLVASERAFLVAEKGREEIHFRWRPWRGKQSVWGSLSFGAPSGDVVLDVRDGEGLRGAAALGRGSAFAAVCQMAGATGLEAAPLVEEHPTGREAGAGTGALVKEPPTAYDRPIG
ncbi:hypothetical protein ACH4S8_12325 [Streptomyces sp. NPDC021080]|uniref:hypothetical protein n=1 Tax=Streptomyces sp. NPDC021080 TaxID=3365110 RepID=UPI00378820C7